MHPFLAHYLGGPGVLRDLNTRHAAAGLRPRSSSAPMANIPTWSDERWEACWSSSRAATSSCPGRQNAGRGGNPTVEQSTSAICLACT
jgi:hypothetical protein